MNYQQETCDFTISEIINIVKIETDSSWRLDNLTTNDHWILSFTLDGEADYYWSGESYRVKKGDTIFFQEGFSRCMKSFFTGYPGWPFLPGSVIRAVFFAHSC